MCSGTCLQDRFISDYDQLQKTISLLRETGHSISMTQGVFDLLHPGHTRYLNEAKAFGDILVVALDSDEYTRARKASVNERRPVVPFNERLELLANLRAVDILTVRDVDFHQTDPNYVNKIVRPDVLVMSKSTKDLTEENIAILRQFCGRVEILDPQATISTTKRLRELLTDGASVLVDAIMETIHQYFEKAGREVDLRKGNGNG